MIVAFQKMDLETLLTKSTGQARQRIEGLRTELENFDGDPRILEQERQQAAEIRVVTQTYADGELRAVVSGDDPSGDQPMEFVVRLRNGAWTVEELNNVTRP